MRKMEKRRILRTGTHHDNDQVSGMFMSVQSVSSVYPLVVFGIFCTFGSILPCHCFWVCSQNRETNWLIISVNAQKKGDRSMEVMGRERLPPSSNTHTVVGSLLASLRYVGRM